MQQLLLVLAIRFTDTSSLCDIQIIGTLQDGWPRHWHCFTSTGDGLASGLRRLIWWHFGCWWLVGGHCQVITVSLRWWRLRFRNWQVPPVVVAIWFNAVGSRILADLLPFRQTVIITVSLHPYDFTFSERSKGLARLVVPQLLILSLLMKLSLNSAICFSGRSQKCLTTWISGTRLSGY